MRSALPPPAPLRRAQPDLPWAAVLPRPVSAGLPTCWLPPFGDWLGQPKNSRRERRSIASTTAALARARSAWLRAGYSARPLRGLPQPSAAAWVAGVAASAAAAITWARRSVIVARLAPATTPAKRAGTNFTERFDICIPGNATLHDA